MRQRYHEEPERDLNRDDKAAFVSLLHQDISLTNHAQSGACTLLAAIESCIGSLSRAITATGKPQLALPCLAATLSRPAVDAADE